MKFKEFTKMYDAEVSKLMDCPKGAWCVYHAIKRCAFIDQKHRERTYWAFPSQLWISRFLGWVPDDTRELDGGQRKKVGTRAVEPLEAAGLIKVHRRLEDIEKQRAKFGKRTKRFKELTREWKRSSEVRDMLVRWGKLRKHSSHKPVIYELIALREVELEQLRGKKAAVNGTEMSGAETKMSGAETKKPPEEEELLIEKNKNNISLFEEENDWSVKTVESKHGHSYSKSQLEKMLIDDFETASKLILSVFTVGELETIDSWLSEWKSKIEVSSLITAVSIKRMGG